MNRFINPMVLSSYLFRLPRAVMAITLFALMLWLAPISARALDDGLARTPPMGWNSWNKFGCDVSEKLIKATADAIATNGMKDAGYQYVVIDDCWQVARDTNGNIVADPVRFPSGIKALADYVHAKGLKFGLYSCAGTNTCGGRPGSLGYEEQDARTYAAWGVDYLKFDWCNHADESSQAAYTRMSQALKKAGRPIIFSLCEWGGGKPWLWGKDVGHLWRTTGDIYDCWDCTNKWSFGWVRILDFQAHLAPFAGPGHWNDPDMLEVGNGGMTTTEYKSHFTLWCIVAAPLIAGNNVCDMTPDTRNILLNQELIAVDQDPLGKQGERVVKNGDAEVWVKPLADGSRAVVLFNRGLAPTEISVTWEQLGYPGGSRAEVRDLWAGKNLGKFEGKFAATVGAHDVVAIKVKP
jgi:alpha-galactosidase